MNDTQALKVARTLYRRYENITIEGPPGFRTVTATGEKGPVRPRRGPALYCGGERPLLYEPYGNPPTVGAEA